MINKTEWVLIARTPAGKSSGAALWLDPEANELHFDSWYDGSFQGPELDIAWTELSKRVAAVMDAAKKAGR